MMKKKDFKDNLLRFSQDKGLSLSNLENKARLHKNYLSNLFGNEGRSPKIDALINIANVLEISIDELIGRESNFTNTKHKRIIENEQLFQEVVEFLAQTLKDNDLASYNYQDIFNYLYLFYEYCLENDHKIDSDYGLFLFRKIFS